jgi:hypothetical protein
VQDYLLVLGAVSRSGPSSFALIPSYFIVEDSSRSSTSRILFLELSFSFFISEFSASICLLAASQEQEQKSVSWILVFGDVSLKQ